MTVTISRLLERFLATPAGREIATAAEAEDVNTRRVHADAILAATTWCRAELDRLGAQRTTAAERLETARAAYETERQALGEIDRQMRWTRSEADRRRSIAERELHITAPPELATTLQALGDLQDAARGAFRVLEWSERTIFGPRRMSESNAADVQAAVDAITAATANVERLKLEATPAALLGRELQLVRVEVLAAARTHGIDLEWPA